MSIDGRITVDATIHDRSGSSRLKVLSLTSSETLATGAVAVVSGTAGTASKYIDYTSYRNAAGDVVSITSPYKVAFSWSGSAMRTLNDAGGGEFRLNSRNGDVAITSLPGAQFIPQIATDAAGGTGTYTLLIWGATNA